MNLTLSEPICYILLPPGLLMFRLHVIQTQPKEASTKSSIVSKEVRVIAFKIHEKNLLMVNLSYLTETSVKRNIVLVDIILAKQFQLSQNQNC